MLEPWKPCGETGETAGTSNRVVAITRLASLDRHAECVRDPRVEELLKDPTIRNQGSKCWRLRAAYGWIEKEHIQVKKYYKYDRICKNTTSMNKCYDQLVA